jgi:hypothetical protein
MIVSTYKRNKDDTVTIVHLDDFFNETKRENVLNFDALTETVICVRACNEEVYEQLNRKAVNLSKAKNFLIKRRISKLVQTLSMLEPIPLEMVKYVNDFSLNAQAPHLEKSPYSYIYRLNNGQYRGVSFNGRIKVFDSLSEAGAYVYTSYKSNNHTWMLNFDKAGIIYKEKLRGKFSKEKIETHKKLEKEHLTKFSS